MEALVNLEADPRLPPNDAMYAWAAKMATWVHCVGVDGLRQWCPVLGDELSVCVEQDPRFVAWSVRNGKQVASYASMVGVITRAVTDFAQCGYNAKSVVAVKWTPVPEAYDTLMEAGMWGAASNVGDDPMLVQAPYAAVVCAMQHYPRPWKLAHWVDDEHCVLSTDEAVFAYAAHELADVGSAVQMLGHNDALVRQYAGSLYTQSVNVKCNVDPNPLAAHIPELATTPDGVLAMLHCPDLPSEALDAARTWAANRADFELQNVAVRQRVVIDGYMLTESTVLRSMALSPYVPQSIRGLLQTGIRCRVPPPHFERLGDRRLPSVLVGRHGAYPATTGADWALDLLQYKRIQAGRQ